MYLVVLASLVRLPFFLLYLLSFLVITRSELTHLFSRSLIIKLQLFPPWNPFRPCASVVIVIRRQGWSVSNKTSALQIKEAFCTSFFPMTGPVVRPPPPPVYCNFFAIFLHLFDFWLEFCGDCIAFFLVDLRSYHTPVLSLPFQPTTVGGWEPPPLQGRSKDAWLLVWGYDAICDIIVSMVMQ